jgi:hypothetical protein
MRAFRRAQEISLRVATCLHKTFPSMVSTTLSQLLERARVRFGVEVEILDSRLKNLYPEGGTDLSRSIKDSAAVRGVLLAALAAGRPHRLESSGHQYRIYPLSRSAPRRHPGGLLAIRRNGTGVSDSMDTEPWSDLARAMVEADFAAVDSLSDERQRSRRLTGALRFLEFVMDAVDEIAVVQALVHAAAVWYDVDSRVYRRSVTGDLVLHTWLPGVEPDAEGLVLNPHLVGNQIDLIRLESGGELGTLATGHEAVVVPLTAAGRAEWALVLIGTVPPDADAVLRLVGRAAGAQLASLAARRSQEARAQFEALLSEPTKAPELLAVRAVHMLAHAVGAGSASLTLLRNGQARRIAALGAVVADAAGAGTHVPTADRLMGQLPLGGEDFATLELTSVAGMPFTPEAVGVFDACAAVLRTWIAGALSSFDVPTTLPYDMATDTPGFSVRIQEELERARRFDLRLCLILVDFAAPADAGARLQEALRSELRGSDVTGKMSGSQVAALLTHTDALGLDIVVRRLKLRLADAAGHLNVSDLKLGQAAFSPEVRTAEALLELALRQAEPVIVH